MNFGTFLCLEKRTQKKIGYYEMENIDNPCLVTITVNPEEYLQVVKNLKLNKKYKKALKKRLKRDEL